MICATLKSVVEPMGHEVFNYGMYSAEDTHQLTYVQNGILAAVLLNSGGIIKYFPMIMQIRAKLTDLLIHFVNK